MTQTTAPSSGEQASLIKGPLRFYISAQPRSFVLGMFFLLITNSLDATYPLILLRGVDQITAKAPSSEILQTCGIFLALMLGLAVSRYFWRVYFGNYHTLAADDVRQRLFRQLTKLGGSFYRTRQIGELISLLINDIQSFRTAIGSAILILVDSVMIMCLILPVMFYLNWKWTLQCLVLLPFIPFLTKFVSTWIFQNFKKQQQILGDLSGFAGEIIMGIRVIKGFAHEKIRLFHYEKLNRLYENQSNHTAFADALFSPTMKLGVTVGSVILLFISAEDMISGAATIGTFVAFQRYITKMGWPMTGLGMGISQYQKGMASFARIKEVLSTAPEISDLGKIKLSEVKSISFNHLSLSYPGSSLPCLQNINCRIVKGQFMAVVGQVGSGKSTLLSLLVRYLEAPSNSVLINDTPIQEFLLSSLRNAVTLIPQDTFLFSDSVIGNVKMSAPEDATEAKLASYFDDVQLTEEIRAFENGYHSLLGERGINISGGQKQRISLARGLARQSQVVVFDDPLTAVDQRTEELINRKLLDLKQKGLTVIIATNRMQIAQQADFILVLKDGRQESFGTPQDLMNTSETFKTLCGIQGLV